MGIASNSIWVFGYGSLVWSPEFSYDRSEIATLKGYERSFCMRSFSYRGTKAAPGLVLALHEKPSASCTGVAFQLPEASSEKDLVALRKRELTLSGYVERALPVSLADNTVVKALCYVIEKDHPHYCGALTFAEQASIIARAHGARGANTEYLYNTADKLNALGICDPSLNELAENVRVLNELRSQISESFGME